MPQKNISKKNSSISSKNKNSSDSSSSLISKTTKIKTKKEDTSSSSSVPIKTKYKREDTSSPVPIKTKYKREESSSPIQRKPIRKRRYLFKLDSNTFQLIASFLQIKDITALDQTTKKAHAYLKSVPLDLTLLDKVFTFQQIDKYFSTRIWNIVGIKIKDNFIKTHTLTVLLSTSLRSISLSFKRGYIKEKKDLNFLKLCSHLEKIDFNESPGKDLISLNKFSRLQSLSLDAKEISIKYFTKFNIPTLISLTVIEGQFTSLDFLQGVPNLIKLYLENAEKLRDINGLKYCPHLQKLGLWDLPDLNMAPNFEPYLTSLRKLYIVAPRESYPYNINYSVITNLVKLSMEFVSDISRSNFDIDSQSLLEIDIFSEDNGITEYLCKIPNILTPNLTKLTLVEMKIKHMEEKMSTLTSLVELKIEQCVGFSNLRGIPGKNSLRTLDIEGRNDYTDLSGLEEHTKIEHIRIVSEEDNDCKYISDLGNKNTLKTLYLAAFSNLRNLNLLVDYSRLQSLTLINCEKLKSVIIPVSLIYLEVNRCEQIKVSSSVKLPNLTKIKWIESGILSFPFRRLCVNLKVIDREQEYII
jgi:hypothetical protein